MTSFWNDLKAEARFRLYAHSSGQVLCETTPAIHALSTTSGHTCPECKAVV